MTFQEIQELIKLLNKSNLAEFKLENGEFKLSIRTSLYKETKASHALGAPVPAASHTAAHQADPPPPAPAPVAPASREAAPAPAEAPEPKAPAEKAYKEVKSPMVGTFYRSASPEKPVFVEVGQSFKKGDVVCIIEAMKLFNEIEADFGGKIVKVMVDNAQPVEYDQVLFLVEPE